MRQLDDLSGRNFGRLMVICRTEKPINVKNNKPYWLCECECGNQKVIKGSDLKSGNTQSCGCLMIENIKKANTTHGMYGTRFYTIWQDMKSRCNYSRNDNYAYYGGRGIEICKEWYSFNNFMIDMYDSYVDFENEYGKNSATLDRVNVNGNYEINNCRWATILEQNRNKRNSKKGE